jgi:hypothetical protein
MSVFGNTSDGVENDGGARIVPFHRMIESRCGPSTEGGRKKWAWMKHRE